MYQVALCEDEKIFTQVLEKICRQIFENLKTEYRITAFSSGEDFLRAFSDEHQRFDLILLDIVMGGISGIELARKIRETDREATIIFVTSHKEYVFEGYDVNALHYLLKPVDAALLERLVIKAYKDRFQSSFLSFKSGTQNHRIAVKDIVSLETRGRKVRITLADRTLLYSGKLAELLDELPNDAFVRCHQSHAISIGNIRELTRFAAIATNGKKVPISRAYLKAVQKAFLANMQEV